MIVGVTGFFAAGKDTVAEYLIEKGYAHVSLSDLLREAMRSEGIETTIPNMTEYGNQLRAKGGSGALGAMAAKTLRDAERAVVTSIRHPDEARELRAGDNAFRLLFISSDPRVRFQRIQRRARPGDPATFEEFQIAERKQLESANPAAQQLLACRDIADLEIQNDADLEDLYQKVEAALG